MKTISKIKPYLFDNYLIIALSKDWIDVCKGIPEFSVILDNNQRICLVGPKLESSSEK